MKVLFAAAVAFFTTITISAQQSTTAPARAAAAPPSSPVTVEKAPATPVAQTPPAAAPVIAEAPASPANKPASSTSGAETPNLSGQIDWSGDSLELRPPAHPPGRTNTAAEMRGVIPKLTKTERRGFGGFLSAFANLFNPFAPTEQGVAVSDQHWYDSQISPLPLPHGFRDERTHEPSWELHVIALEAQPKSPNLP